MFVKGSNDGFKEVLPDIRMKTLVHGENTLLVEFRLAKGADLPNHKHPHEQTGYLVSGRIELNIQDETWLVEAGGSWAIPGHFEHSARALENSVAVEVFSPVREEYLP
jgi:unsaturated pyranuronate lyase